MTAPHIIMWAIVLAVGVPSAWRNPTASALVLCWIAVEAIFVLTGDNLAVQYYLFPDVFVLAVIFAKRERTGADWIVAAIFPVMWMLYIANLHPFYKWWALYYLVLAQFLTVGLDSFLTYRREHRAVSDSAPSGFSLVWARGSG